MKNYVHSGDSLAYKNESGATITAGSPVLIGSKLGVALDDILDDAEGTVVLEGVFEIRKATGAITQGAKLYWDADGNPVGGASQTGALTTTDSGNTFVGWAFAAAGSTAATVHIKLDE